MRKLSLEWRVGLFVTIGLVLLGLLLLQFNKGMTFFRPTYTILLKATSVSGLRPRADVVISGVKVGSVDSITLAPEGKNVHISLKIYKQYRVYKDSTFRIETSGFLGDQYVAIVPSKNQGGVFQDMEVAQADEPFDLQEVARSAKSLVSRVEESLGKLDEAFVDIRRLLLNPETLTNLSTAVYNLRNASDRAVTTLENLNSVVTSNAPSIHESGTNLVVFSRQLTEFSGSLNSLLAGNSNRISSSIANIETSSEKVKGLLTDLENGKGFAGNVLKDEHLSGQVSNIAHNLSVTTSNLNRLGLWGILWKKKQPKERAIVPNEVLRTPKDNRK